MTEKLNKKTFFVTGVGTGYVNTEDGVVPLLQLQDMKIELKSKTEDIFGGESMFSLYNFMTEKSTDFSFTSAAMSLDMIRVTQGSDVAAKAMLFETEIGLAVAADGTITLANTAIEADSVLVLIDGEKVAATYAGGKLKVDDMTPYSTVSGLVATASYRYTSTDASVTGSSILTTSIPGYVELRHVSNPIKQKDGSVIQIYTTIYKARSDGSLTIDYKQKNAYAPELKFSAVDPERADKKFVDFAVKRLS